MEPNIAPHCHPKSLILNVSFNPREGAGITIGNLFWNWPIDCLANACINCYHDDNKCINYFDIGTSKTENNKQNKNGNIVALDSGEFKNSPLKKLLIGFKTTGESFGFINKISLSAEFLTWVQKFDPQIIYAVSFSAKDIPFLIAIKNSLNIPMVLHIYDDWIEHNRYGYFKFLFSWIVKLRFKKLLKKCDGHFAISEKMAEVYTKRYGLKFKSFHNPSNFSPSHRRHINLNKREIKIGIFGTVGENNINEIMLLNDAVNEFESADISIHLYGSIRKTQMIEDLVSKARIVVHGLIPHNEIYERLIECDILFLPLSFKKANKRYLQLSMPTKFTEFLSSGVPILVFAPSDFALSEYSRKNKCAFVVSNYSKEELLNGLHRLIENNENTVAIISKALDLFSKSHNIEKVSENFKNNLLKFVK